MTRLGICAVVAAGVLSSSAAAQDTPLPWAKPEDAGMSSARLGEIAKTLNADVARGRIPGAVVAIARRGKLVYFEAFGYRDKAAGVPMTTDTIFNIASMTKPMAAVAALQLYEQGRLLMDDPLAKYFPKFADTKVAVMDAKGETIVGNGAGRAQDHDPGPHRHTSGLIYGGRGTTAVHKLYPAGSGRRGADDGRRVSRQARARCRCCTSPAPRGTTASASTCSGSSSSRSPSRRSAATSQTTCSSRSAWSTLISRFRPTRPRAMPRRCRTIPIPASRNR